MVLDQIRVGPNMGPTKYAGPNLVQPKMADQKCLDQIWLDTHLGAISLKNLTKRKEVRKGADQTI